MYKTWVVVAGSHRAQLQAVKQLDPAEARAQAEAELREELREALREHPSLESQLAAYGAMLLLEGDDAVVDFSDEDDLRAEPAANDSWGRSRHA